MAFRVVDPSTGEAGESFGEHAPEYVLEVIESAEAAFAWWRHVPFADRAGILHRVAERLEEGADGFARLMAAEMGKPVAQGRAEARKCAAVCRYYADHAAAFLEPEDVETGARRSRVVHAPRGVVLAVMPWNFPFWQVFRWAAPALMAGNACVLKHAPGVPGCAEAIERLLHEAGLDPALFRSLRIDEAGVAGVIRHPAVRLVTLTGSTRAGRTVGAVAGEALTPAVLELGGSDPYVVLADADLEVAARACVDGRMLNAGQSCIAAKRWIVVPEVRDAFERRTLELMAARRVGDPRDEETDVGPMARVDLRDCLHAQVDASVAAGARLLLGGVVPDRPGAWYPPTVLTDVGPGMPAYDEELFGPVAAILPATDEADALRIANDTSFGLGAAVFTRDLERGERIAATELDAGACFVNAFVRSDPRLPFGGVKDSGYGRELARHGLLEFVNVKTVWVD